MSKVKKLTNEESKLLRYSVTKVNLKDNTSVYYGLGTKESKSSFFSNERLLLLHQAQKSLRYYKQIPSQVPFGIDSQIMEGKQKIVYDKVSKFKCKAVAQNFSFQVSWFEGTNENKWLFTMANMRVRNQWVDRINEIMNGDIKKKVQNQDYKIKISEEPQQLLHNKRNTIQNEYNNNNNNIQYNIIQNNQKQKPIYNSKDNLINQSINNPNNISYSNNMNNYNNLNNSLSNANNSNSNRNISIKNEQNQNNSIIDNNKNKEQLLNETNKIQNSIESNKIINLAPPPSQDRKILINDSLRSKESFQNINDSFNQNGKSSFKLFNNKNQNTNNNDANLQYEPILQQNELKSIPLQQNKQINKIHYQNILNSQNAQQGQIYKRKSININNNKSPILDEYSTIRNYNYQQGQSQHQFRISKFQKSRNNNNSSNNNNSYNEQPYNRSMNRMASDLPLKQINKKEYFLTSRNKDQQLLPESALGYYMGTSEQESNLMKQEISSDNRIKKTSQIKQIASHSQKYTKWNEIWCESNQKLPIYQKFINLCHQLVETIINELPLTISKQYLPEKNQSPFYIYKIQGIIITIHYYNDETNLINTYEQQTNLPLLRNNCNYEELKRQFYNYNLILGATGNKNYIKIPMCCLIEYKGIIAFCKAQINQKMKQISPTTIQTYLENIEKIIKVQFMFGSFNCYSHPNSKYVILDGLTTLIPTIPIAEINFQSYFRKEFLLHYHEILDDLQSSSQANNFIIQNIIPDFLSKLQSLQSWICCSKDLHQQMHFMGISMGYLKVLYQTTNSYYLKRIFISQIVSLVFTDIIRSQINHVYWQTPIQNLQQISIQHLNSILIDCLHLLIEELFRYSLQSQNIWKLLVREINTRYNILISKQDLLPGYLLSGIIYHNGIRCNFKQNNNFNYNKQFFIANSIFPRNIFESFQIQIRRYDLEDISPEYQKIYQIIHLETNSNDFQEIIQLFNLQTQKLPIYCNRIKSAIFVYLSNFIPFERQYNYQHLQIYSIINQQPYTNYSIKIILIAIKWLVKNKQISKALELFNSMCNKNIFWLSEYNTPMTEFYDFFSMYYASQGQYDNAIKLAKSSFINVMKLLGIGSLPLADKHYQLGNIYFKMANKDEALKEYEKTKIILQKHHQKQIPQYGKILLKLSLLYLNYGQMSNCVSSALQALKIFDSTSTNSISSQQQEIQTFEILSRAYQILHETKEIQNLSLICSQKFNSTQNNKIFERMLKIVLIYKFENLSSKESRLLLLLCSQLQQNLQINYQSAWIFLHRKSYDYNIIKKLFSFLNNIVILMEQIKKKNLIRKYKSLSYDNKNNQAIQMLVLFQAILRIVSHNFLIGCLKQANYYD